ncbi:hypothetical protein [Sphingomonas sp.]|uniref:hypothetical protein n=1 Tax=Sphingomonas sp. TaxID=28214 RepID=UPI003B39FB92
MADKRGKASSVGVGATPDATSDDELARIAERAVQARRRLCAELDPQIFGHPPMELLLDLFVAGTQGRTVLDASLSAHAPQSVTLRWLSQLARMRLVEEFPAPARDPDRGAQPLVRLSEKGRAALRASLTMLALHPTDQASEGQSLAR